MKKLIILASLCLSLSIQAQFIETNPPTEFALKLNNTRDLAELLKLASVARVDKNHKDLLKIMEKIVELKPTIGVFKYQLAEAYALNDDKTNAFNTLILLQKQGLFFDLAASENFANINTYPVYDYIKENMDANGKHFGAGTEAFNVDKSFSGLLFESLVVDNNSRSFLMGSLRDGSVIKIENDGNITVLVAAASGGVDGPWAAIDLAVDEKNDTLWVASAAISQFGKVNKESSGLAGIFKYKLSTGKLLKSYRLPENKRPSFISSMHLTSQGDLYFIGSIKNVVLKLAKDAEQISLVFTSKEYTNLGHITTDETGNILYVSDSEKGIIMINVANGKYLTIENSENLDVTGISDLIYDDNSLIMVQDGITPKRIIRLKLNQDKNKVANIFPIESANPLFNSISSTVVVGEGLYYIANSQVPKTNMYGGLAAGQQWENMLILVSPKHFKEQATIEYQNRIEAHKKKTGSK